MPRDYESENYAIANGYDLADAATEAWSEEPPEAPEESEAERLSYAFWNLQRDLSYTRGLLGRPGVGLGIRGAAELYLAELEGRLAEVHTKLTAALERERAGEGGLL